MWIWVTAMSVAVMVVMAVAVIQGRHHIRNNTVKTHPEFYAAVNVVTAGPVNLRRPPTWVDREIMVRGYRVLVKDQEIEEHNGIYVIHDGNKWEPDPDFVPQHGRWVWSLSGREHGKTLWETIVVSDQLGVNERQPLRFERAANVLTHPPQKDLYALHGDCRWRPLYPRRSGEYYVQHRTDDEHWQMTPVHIADNNDVWAEWDRAIVVGQKINRELDLNKGKWFTVRVY